MPKALQNLDRLCIHTITTKPWEVETAINKYAAKGVKGITVWRQALEGKNAKEVGKLISDAGLTAVSLCRGGFFPAADEQAKQKAIKDNLEAIDQAADIGAPLVVLVCGAIPKMPLAAGRKQITEGIRAVLEHAQSRGVKLAIEPLHPMYADCRSAVNTMKQANDICEEINSPWVGVAVDVYHLWWDPELESEIKRCGKMNKIMAFHVCDWRTPTEDLLNDRGLMGEGCIDIPQIRGWVEDSGFDGMIEVEIFSNRWWSGNQDAFLNHITDSYLQFV